MNTISSSNERFLDAIELLQARASRAQNQISTGLRVSKASDDPAAVGDIFILQSEIAQSTQAGKNLGSVKAEVDAASSSLGQAVNLLQNAISLGAQGANGTSTASDRKTVALQVKGLLEQLVGLSRTQVSGSFIFSGDASTAPAYQLNLLATNGVDRLVQGSSTRLIQDGTGTTFSASRTAQDILDHRNPDDSLASDNAFAALNQLRVALENNDQAGIGTAVDAVKAAHGWVGEQLGFYGAVQNRVATAAEAVQKYGLDHTAALSGARDADITAAIVELTQTNTNLEAAMAAQAHRATATLFDFLK